MTAARPALADRLSELAEVLAGHEYKWLGEEAWQRLDAVAILRAQTRAKGIAREHHKAGGSRVELEGFLFEFPDAVAVVGLEAFDVFESRAVRYRQAAEARERSLERLRQLVDRLRGLAAVECVSRCSHCSDLVAELVDGVNELANVGPVVPLAHHDSSSVGAAAPESLRADTPTVEAPVGASADSAGRADGTGVAP